MSKINIIEITFPSLNNIKNEEDYFRFYTSSNAYLNCISDDFNITAIKFVGFSKVLDKAHLQFVFSSKRSYFSKLIFLHQTVTSLNGKQVFVINGFRFPHYTFLLQLFYRVPIILWHHAELPSQSRIKNLIYQLQNNWVRRYLFNGIDNAKPWINKGILDKAKISEIPEASSHFQFHDTKSKSKPTFIWIGRLIEGKHPLVFLRALKLLAESNLVFEAYFIYQTGELEKDVLSFIEINKMQAYLYLKKDIDANEVECLLNLANYFVSCSSYEGSGYSLIEALACGCIPIVSDIPAFNYLLNDLELKHFISKRFPEDLFCLLEKIVNAHISDIDYLKIRNHFDLHLSSATIAKKIEQYVKE
jgi:glycosyltransferase involved in cell wall biosynthesis